MTDSQKDPCNFWHQGATVSAGQYIAGLVAQPFLCVLTNTRKVRFYMTNTVILLSSVLLQEN